MCHEWVINAKKKRKGIREASFFRHSDSLRQKRVVLKYFYEYANELWVAECKPANKTNSLVKIISRLFMLIMIFPSICLTLAQEWSESKQQMAASQAAFEGLISMAHTCNHTWITVIYYDFVFDSLLIQPPQPHSFSYDETDEEGNQRFHSETGDGSGKVTGTYGYKDAYGVYRVVDYVADENGYRATIRSNEPGMEAPGPADVELNVETPPANVFLGHQLYPSSSELRPSYARRT